MKRKILIAYPEMNIGGSTTSLLNLLNTIDYSLYDVDLLLYRKTGDHFKDIPPEVNILPQAFRDVGNFVKIRETLKNGYLLRAVASQMKYKRRLGLNMQVMAYAQASISKGVTENYDAAIGFLELWANAFVIDDTKVKADKRINWIHTDYKNCSFIPEIDRRFFNKTNAMICVSSTCLANFTSVFPELKSKSFFIENILSEKFILSKAEEKPDWADFPEAVMKVLTVCRLSIETKGLDRAVNAMKRLKSEGYKFKWYIVGDGEDRKELETMIDVAGLQNDMILLGKKTNPYPFYRQCDLFVLPSRYEGKPIVVTEAQILGIPALVTKYASAEEQIESGVNGMIIENNDESTYSGIKQILDRPALLPYWKENLGQTKFSNEDIIEKFYALLE